jgi:hypothetical protein
MTYLYEAIKPTRIYIKQCSHCNKRYMGKSVKDNITSYKGSGVVWTRHLKKYNATSVHIWNSDWFCDKSIAEYALSLSKEHDITESDEWFNIRDEDGLMGGNVGSIGNNKRRKTMLDSRWKESVGLVANIKRSNTLKNVMNDPTWKSTKGIEKRNKQSLIQNDPIWKSTKGIEKRNKASQSISKVKNDLNWKSVNYKSCEYCYLNWIDPANYSRWHGDRCKMKGR